MEKGKENYQMGTACLIQYRMEPEVKRLESVRDRI